MGQQGGAFISKFAYLVEQQVCSGTYEIDEVSSDDAGRGG